MHSRCPDSYKGHGFATRTDDISGKHLPGGPGIVSLSPYFRRASGGPRGPEGLVPVGGAVGGGVARSRGPSFGGNWTRLVGLPGRLVSDLG